MILRIQRKKKTELKGQAFTEARVSSASGEVGLIETIRNFTINSEKHSKQSQSESWATGNFRDRHKFKIKSLYNQSPKLFYNKRQNKTEMACNCSEGSLIPRGNVNIWVMEILMKTCWTRLLMLSVVNTVVSDCEGRQHWWQTCSFLNSSSAFLWPPSTPQLQASAIKLFALWLDPLPVLHSFSDILGVLTNIPWRPAVNKSSASSLPTSVRSAPTPSQTRKCVSTHELLIRALPPLQFS